MVGVDQNLNGSRDLTTPISGKICHLWASMHLLRSTYPPNLNYLHPLQRWKAIQNIKNGVVWS